MTIAKNEQPVEVPAYFTRDQHRSLWLSYAVAGKIAANPLYAKQLALRNIKKMRVVSKGQTQQWIDRWEILIDGPVEEILNVLTSKTSKGQDMRQNTPFAGILTELERTRVLKAWKAAYSKRSS